MTSENLAVLATLIKQQRKALLVQWRQQVRKLPSAQGLDNPTLNDHIPDLLDELAAALIVQARQDIAEPCNDSSPRIHGLQRLNVSFELEEVVAEYNILRGCIHDLADQNGVILQGEPFHILNRVFDRAIGLALSTYTAQQAMDVQERRQEYLAFVAHDLRTPLSAISTAGRVLEMMLPQQVMNDPDLVQLLKALNRNVKHLENLISKVIEENTHLQTETGIRLERREFDLWPVVESIILDFRPLVEETGTKLLNRVPDETVVFADAGLIRRILQNLIANAIRYTTGGTIEIGAERLETCPGIANCWVADNGSGIPAEQLSQVFDKGATDPENEEGEGLGLAIVKAFIEAHQGTVSVDSKVGVGTTFRFSLPDRTNPTTTSA
ncbi:sensor histidine kinase [Schlesneria sp. DSM 10557]|uniref:sensor histidine kinase n=1 Tax=Schlesneria sp. DSM 10557 TaxID=3044399 RepID=UPI00359F2495